MLEYRDEEDYHASDSRRAFIDPFDNGFDDLRIEKVKDGDAEEDLEQETGLGFESSDDLDAADEEEGDEKEEDGFLTSLLEPAAADWSSDDPIKVYLREMGKVPLLTKQQEVSLSKQIEEGHNIVRGAVFQTSLAVADIRKLLNGLQKQKIRTVDVLDLPTRNRSGTGTRYVRMARASLTALNEIELELRVAGGICL